MRIENKNAQKTFDKRIRYFKRQFRKKDIDELGKLAAEKSTDVWLKSKKLNAHSGPKSAREIV